MANYRYPGAYSFGDSLLDQHRFFGREQERQEVINKVLSSNLLVLFGKSGLGKTSLLHAAVFPSLRQRHLLPLKIRVFRRDADPVSMVIEAVEEACRAQEVDLTIGQRDGLWEFFKTALFWKDGISWTPVLILDQFEEIFTLLEPERREEIAAQLGDLVGSGLPLRVRQRQQDAADDADDLLSDAPPDVKLILSLREEYVGALQELFPAVPAILNNRVRLAPMALEQVKRAVIAPAQRDDALFDSLPFAYSNEALNKLLGFLSSSDSEGSATAGSNCIEPFQLQILCHHIELKVMQRQQPGETVEVVEADLGTKQEMDSILHNFYLSAIEQLPVGKARKQARELCEFGLLNDQGRRESLALGAIRDRYGLDEKALNTLVDALLLRKEPLLGSFNYELTHDSLCKPIMRNRPFRLPKWAKWGAALLVLLFVGVVVFQQYQAEIQSQHKLDMEQKKADFQREASKLVQGQQQKVDGFLKVLRRGISQLEQGNTDGAIQTQKKLESDMMALLMQDAAGSQVEPGTKAGEERTFAGMPFVWIPAGEFEMGSNDGEADEKPVHKVNIRQGFWLGKTEVTFDQYDAFAVATGRDLPGDQGWGRGDRPVINVSWEDAVAYTEWLAEKSGSGYRLPTEAEWEYAARAKTATKYSWGDEIDCSKASYDGGEGSACYYNPKGKWRGTSQVGSYAVNPWNLYDMHGNVWEWVQDCYIDNYNNGPTIEAAREEGKCGSRVLRGGSWSFLAYWLRSAIRYSNTPSIRSGGIGFRLARSAPRQDN